MAAEQSLLRRAASFFTEPKSESRSYYNPWGAPPWFSYQGHIYGLSMPPQSLGGKQEEPDPSFRGFVDAAYNTNGIIFACNQARMRLFAEARFQFRQLRQGTPGDLFGTPELQILETPWPGGTTRDLLKRMIQDVDVSGNCYVYRDGNRLRRLRPDWVSIVLGSNRDSDDPSAQLDAEVIGYLFHPGGAYKGYKPIPLLTETVAHYAPIPDPLALYRGMSWLTPIIREFMADNAATDHKLKFFENGATVNLALAYPETIDKELFDKYVSLFRNSHEGVANAYRTLHLGGGATPIPIGSNMEQIDFRVVQGAGETRIAAAAGVPPIVVGLSEGLQAATYSNYGQARRAFADGTMRDLWGDVSGSLATIVNVPSGSDLWYDDRNIAFLQDDELDSAHIMQSHATTVNTLIIAGYEPNAVIDAVLAGDLARLRNNHTGLFSVQLQPPGTEAPQPSTNGAPAAAPSR